MLYPKLSLRSALLSSIIALGFIACSDDNLVAPEPDLRAKIDYTKITATTPYKALFLDAKGDTTVDFTASNNCLKMFQALNYYLGSAVRDTKELDAVVMKNMYANTGNAFVDVPSLNITGATLNTSGVQLRDKTASSKPTAEAEPVRTTLEEKFTEMAAASKSVTVTASKGVAGKLGTYLVDAKGIEIAQIIQKGLIGGLQLDYISNVLLVKGLEADNRTLVTGTKYTALEHNWDEAYGFLTLNPVYLAGATEAAKGAPEFFLGSYLWEYNRTTATYAKIHPAFVKGRAAIVNNDAAELKTQATFIRTEMERAIAKAAVGYLAKWSAANTTDAARAHAMGEGLGFIYSLRFCSLNGADAAFSDGILTALIGSANGFWDLTPLKITTASDAINAKFKL